MLQQRQSKQKITRCISTELTIRNAQFSVAGKTAPPQDSGGEKAGTYCLNIN